MEKKENTPVVSTTEDIKIPLEEVLECKLNSVENEDSSSTSPRDQDDDLTAGRTSRQNQVCSGCNPRLDQSTVPRHYPECCRSEEQTPYHDEESNLSDFGFFQ